jgi:hypothetical protein
VLGYKQELKRQMTYYGSVGTTLGCSQVRRSERGAACREHCMWPRLFLLVCVLTPCGAAAALRWRLLLCVWLRRCARTLHSCAPASLGRLLLLRLNLHLLCHPDASAAGPVSVIWGFIGCFVWCFFLALSLAEISSQYTVAGGPYYCQQPVICYLSARSSLSAACALQGRARWPANWAVSRRTCRVRSMTETKHPVPVCFGLLTRHACAAWVMYLTFVAGITSYEFQIAQQLISIKLILDNSKLGTPPGALGDISGVPFGVAVPNVTNKPFQNALYGIMVGFAVFHACANMLPVKHMNKIALASFTWLMMISSVIMCAPCCRQQLISTYACVSDCSRRHVRRFALPAITPKRNGGAFIFGEWIGATIRPELDSTAPAPAPAMGPAPATVSGAMSIHATGVQSNGWTAMCGLLMVRAARAAQCNLALTPACCRGNT